MIEVRETAVFIDRLADLRDVSARLRIVARIRRLEAGSPGDVRPVGDGVQEMPIDYGPGYRVYFVYRESVVVILLCGGDKRRQKNDIARAKSLARET